MAGFTFYYDFGSPSGWLAAEQVVEELGSVPEFVPVSLAGLPAGQVGPFRCEAEIDAHFEDLARRASAHGLLALRRPPVFPADTQRALLAATYARQIGKVVAFSLALLRQVFNAGRDLEDEDTILLAGAAAEIHPAALVKGAALRSTAQRLEAATREAAAAGVLDLPAVAREQEVRYL